MQAARNAALQSLWAPFPCRNVSASLCGSVLLPGPEEVQGAAAAQAGAVAARALRVSPGCPAREAPGLGLRPRRAPRGPAGPGDRARPRLRRPWPAPRPAGAPVTEIIAAAGADVPGQSWELMPSQVRVLLEERLALQSLHFSDNYFFQLYFLFMFFKKSTATSLFQIMTLAMAISSPLCGFYRACPMTNCAFILSVWKRRTKPQGMITSVMGLAALAEAHSCQRNYIALCHVTAIKEGTAVTNTRLENWNLKLHLWSGFRSWLSSFYGLDCRCWNQYRFGQCLCTYFLKSVLKHWNNILASTSLYMSLPWQVLLVF